MEPDVVFGGDLKTMMARLADIVPEDAAAGEALTPGQRGQRKGMLHTMNT